MCNYLSCVRRRVDAQQPTSAAHNWSRSSWSTTRMWWSSSLVHRHIHSVSRVIKDLYTSSLLIPGFCIWKCAFWYWNTLTRVCDLSPFSSQTWYNLISVTALRGLWEGGLSSSPPQMSTQRNLGAAYYSDTLKYIMFVTLHLFNQTMPIKAPEVPNNGTFFFLHLIILSRRDYSCSQRGLELYFRMRHCTPEGTVSCVGCGHPTQGTCWW